MKHAQRARLAALARGLQFLASVCVAQSAFLLVLFFGKTKKKNINNLYPLWTNNNKSKGIMTIKKGIFEKMPF